MSAPDREIQVGIICKTSAVGGVSNFAFRLAECLRIAGFNSELVFLRDASNSVNASATGFPYSFFLAGKRARASRALGTPVIRLLLHDAYNLDNAPDPVLWALAPALGRWGGRYDLTIFADESFSLFSVVANAITKLNYAVVAHEGPPPTPNLLAGPQKRLLLQAKVVLSSSPLARSILEERLRREVRLIIMTKPAPDPKIERDPYFLLDTRWTEARNPSLILNLLQGAPLARFVVVGGFFPSRLQEVLRHSIEMAGFSDRIEFISRPTEALLLELYANARAFVRWPAITPTAIETGVGWGVIRAVEAGCPVIIDERMGFAPLVKEYGAGLSVPGNAEAFSKAIRSVSGDDDLASSLSKNATELANVYSIDKSAAELRDIVLDICHD
jgi:glycosyltransferase involved in cell wall biosynthesis